MLFAFFFINIFHFFFFRDPDRKTPEGDKWIIAPADGTIINIDEVEENEYFKQKTENFQFCLTQKIWKEIKESKVVQTNINQKN